MAIQCAPVVTDAFSFKYHSVTHDKGFDRAVRRYRRDQNKATGRKADENGELRSGRSSSQIVPALQANLARISSGEPVPPDLVPPQPTRTLAEAEDRLRTRTELLPAIILKEVYKLRDHTRYFLLANGHADVLGLQVGGANVTPTPNEFAVPEDLKQLLDEIAQEEGFEERLKQEGWDNAHARNVSVLEYRQLKFDIRFVHVLYHQTLVLLSLESEPYCTIVMRNCADGFIQKERGRCSKLRNSHWKLSQSATSCSSGKSLGLKLRGPRILVRMKKKLKQKRESAVCQKV